MHLCTAAHTRFHIAHTIHLTTTENDIVIESMVRSNSTGSIGFMQEPERVNVLLSRARLGLVIIGNRQTLEATRSQRGRELWQHVLQLLDAQDAVMPGLPAVCQLHSDDAVTLLSTPEAFRSSFPNGGCTRLCQSRRQCGHACTLTCHPRPCDEVSKCFEPCARAPCDEGHPCPKRCWQECGACTTEVTLQLPCGHTRSDVPCFKAATPELVRCRELVPFTHPLCGHQALENCFDVRSGTVSCDAPCTAQLACGHQCKGRCGSCNSSSGSGTAQHKKCLQRCERTLVCGHLCSSAVCHDPPPCGPCERMCEARCSHSSCALLC
jgi:AAA domain